MSARTYPLSFVLEAQERPRNTRDSGLMIDIQCCIQRTNSQHIEREGKSWTERKKRYM